MSASSAASKAQPLTVSTYDFSNVKFGKEMKNAEYGFSKYRMTYSREDVNGNDNFIKLTNLTVLGVYEPSPEHKNPKYTVMFGISDEDTATKEFCQNFDKQVLNYVYEHQEQFFEDASQEMTDLDASYKPVFRVSDSGSMSIYVSFPFNNPDVKNPVRIGYRQDVEPELKRSTDLIKKLGKGSVCEVFLNFTNLYKDDTDSFKIQTAIYQRINVIEYKNLESLSSGGFYASPSITELNTDDIVMGSVITNDKNGRSLKPRIKTGEGAKTKAITVSLTGSFRFVKMKDNNTEKINYSVVYNPTDEEVEAFEALNKHMSTDLLQNYGQYEKGKKITEKKLEKQFRGTVTKDKEGRPTMWFTVFARTNESDGTVDFGGNFYKPDGKTRYTNEEIMSVFGEEVEATMNIYFKHIWFGKFYSCKFNMGSVMLDMKNAEYDLDDEAYYDGEGGSNGQEASNDLDQDDEPEGHSGPEDSDDEPTAGSNAPEDSDEDSETEDEDED
jgi:hypothetical protein